MKGYSYEIKAIPTLFQGVMMRSRLEARWAAFFTECGFPWTYEPIDFDEWSPDFSLNFQHKKIYVEVKPMINRELVDELVKVATPVIDTTGARALLVGDSIRYESFDSAIIGIGLGAGTWFDEEDDKITLRPDEIVVGACGALYCEVGMSPQNADYTCWCCDKYDGNPAFDHESVGIQKRWAAACNKTQWKP